MFKIIFVDDESIIRNGISNCIPWGDNGFDMVGVFEDGQQAYNYIKNNPVDVVLTDINMPEMDGLTLSKLLYEEFPDIMVLLLSGYDDFEYAQKALENQVREFLLKPITAEELTQTLSRINSELKNAQNERNKQKEMEEKLAQSIPLLKERFFNMLVSGKISKDNYQIRSEYVKWRDLGAYYQVSIIDIPDSWSELERITLYEFIKGFKNTYDELFFSFDDNIVLLSQEEDSSILDKSNAELVKCIFSYSNSNVSDQVSIGCGEIIQSISMLQDSYKGARNAIDYSRVLGVPQILFIKDVRDEKKILPERFNNLLSEVIIQLKEGKKDASLDAIRSLFRYLEKHFISRNEIYIYYDRINNALLTFINDMGLKFSVEIPINYFNNRSLSIASAENVFIKMIEEIEEQIVIRRNDILVSRIDKSREIIEKRYSEPGFSLQDICNDLYLSTSQFSFIFKEGTGQTFVEYLTNFRVEQAKILLKTTDKKVYEIAEDVGYNDSRYFSIIFKKQTGITALEYRKRL